MKKNGSIHTEVPVSIIHKPTLFDSENKEIKAKSNLSLYLYGAIIILSGIFLILSNYNSFNTLKLTLGIGLTIASAFAFLEALSREKKHVQLVYHRIHATAMLIYGLSVIIFCNSFQMLQYNTAFILIFYAFSEIIFCITLFNLAENINYKIVMIRFSLGLIIGIATISLIYYKNSDLTMVLAGYGILFILIGLNVLFYAPALKKGNYVS